MGWPVLGSSVEQALLLAGRLLVYFAAFCVPLAFCRETMYVFQPKTLIVQYTGLLLALLLVTHQLLSARPLDILRFWLVRLMLLFLLWEVFKSFNSINPVISLRELSRVGWYPFIAISAAYFFRERAQIERLVTVIVASALVANVVAWILYHRTTRDMFIGQPPQSYDETWDLYKMPILGDMIKWLLYPPPFDLELQQLAEEGRKALPISRYSFFPGKHDAGTFGNKNFITAYINLTTPLIIYKAAVLAFFRKERVGRSLRLVLAGLLVMVAIASYFHIMRLGNRGSQIGLMVAIVALGGHLRWIFMSGQKMVRRTMLAFAGLLVVFILVVGITYWQDPARFKSIFSFSSSSNELRIHTWRSYLKAWQEDREFSGFKDDAWRMATGMGNYTFRFIYPKYRSKRIYQLEDNAHNTETSHAHNEYLDYLGELGLVGLSIYMAMLGFVLVGLARLCRHLRADGRELVLIGALLCGLASLWWHQFVEVHVRYTEIAFQYWLTLGLVLTLISLYFGGEPARRAPRHVVVALAGLVLAFTIMPSPAMPLSQFRSQHFYEMGHIGYGQVRNFSDQLEQQKKYHEDKRQELSRAGETLVQLKASGRAGQAAEYEKKLTQANGSLRDMAENIRRNEERFDVIYANADRYFSAGHEYDAANYESLYIGGNMNVQYAKSALINGEYDKARRLFEQALGRYNRIVAEAPYFVQVRFWQGVSYKGLGSCLLAKARAGDAVAKAGMEKYFQQAIESFDHYIRQDAVYLDAYFEKFLIYSNLDKTDEALGEITNILHGMESGGHALFSEDMRFDSLKLLSHTILHARNEAQSRRALQQYAILAQHKKSTGLLPFLPKTDRHGKNGLGFIKR